MGNGGSIDTERLDITTNVCGANATGFIFYYALVNVSEGNDNTGFVQSGSYAGIRPYRTITAALNAMTSTLSGTASEIRGQIIYSGPLNVPDNVNGNLTINERIFIRGGDQSGNVYLSNRVLNITGTLTLRGNNRFDSMYIRARRIEGVGATCGINVTFIQDSTLRGADTFININNGSLGMYDSTIQCDGLDLITLQDSSLKLNKCNVIERNGDIGFYLDNSKAELVNCKLDMEVNVMVEEINNSSFIVQSSDIVVKGDYVILNKVNDSISEYKRSYIKVEANSIEDSVTGNTKIKYEDDILEGNYVGLLDAEKADYVVWTEDGGVSSYNNIEIIRGASEYEISSPNGVFIFKHSDTLVVRLPKNPYNGSVLSLKFIDVHNRKIVGKFNKHDMEKIKNCNNLKLVNIDKVWYLY